MSKGSMSAPLERTWKRRKARKRDFANGEAELLQKTKTFYYLVLTFQK